MVKTARNAFISEIDVVSMANFAKWVHTQGVNSSGTLDATIHWHAPRSECKVLGSVHRGTNAVNRILTCVARNKKW